jgi:peptidoglycan hydrolase-like protein with peptidoglycan-binding domain
MAEQLTVESLIGLKELGFSEAEIQQQVTRSGTAVHLTDVEVDSLKNAGFSEATIQFLRNPQPATTAPALPAGIGEDRLLPRQPPTEPEPPQQPVAEPPEIQPPPAPRPPAVSREQLLEIQQTLNALGYDAGVADGIMGRRTAAAIRNFQRDTGITLDGKASPQLLMQLRVQLKQSGGVRPHHGQPQRLVGSWQSVYQGSYGYSTEMYLDLFPDGSFTSSSSSAMGYAEVSGTYTVQSNVLTLLNQYGQTEDYPFRLQGKQLIVRMPGIAEEVIFSRYAWEMQ